jgi:hypothetical protein
MERRAMMSEERHTDIPELNEVVVFCKPFRTCVFEKDGEVRLSEVIISAAHLTDSLKRDKGD